jgi:hypothetical protein
MGTPENDEIVTQLQQDIEWLSIRLQECHDLLNEIAFHVKPMPSGFQIRVKELLEAQGALQQNG